MTEEKQVRGIALPNLRAWRQSKGLSQRELGELSGVQYSQISRIERQGQHVTPQTIKRLAAALGITREALIGENPEAQKEAPAVTSSGREGAGTSISAPAIPA